MASISGKDGSVTFSGGETTVKLWNLSYTGDVLETTNFDDSSGGRTFIAGLTGWSGSYDALYSTANTTSPGTSGTIYLRSSTGTVGVWSGTAFITGMDISTPRDGLVTQSYTFQGSGTLAGTS